MMTTMFLLSSCHAALSLQILHRWDVDIWPPCRKS